MEKQQLIEFLEELIQEIKESTLLDGNISQYRIARSTREIKSDTKWANWEYTGYVEVDFNFSAKYQKKQDCE